MKIVVMNYVYGSIDVIETEKRFHNESDLHDFLEEKGYRMSETSFMTFTSGTTVPVYKGDELILEL